MPQNNSTILALDVGDIRVGVAMARSDVRLPVAVTTLLRAEPAFWQQLTGLLQEHQVSQLVLGLPRGLDGQETAQTASVRAFAAELATYTDLPLRWQDEALTSVKAESALNQAGKPYSKADIDSLAACYILSDYIDSQRVSA